MKLFTFIFALLITSVSFSQDQSVAVIVEEHSEKFGLIFFCKIALLVIIGIVAIGSYLKFQKQENLQD